MPPIENLWYDDNLNYDVSYIRSQVVPSVECGYPYKFEVMRFEIDSNFNDVILPLPTEVEFVWDQTTDYIAFNIVKCNPIGVNSPFDQECNDGTIPYQKAWNLRMKVTLMQPDGDSFGFVDFPARIRDPCVVDEVSMVRLMDPQIAYTIQNTPYIETYEVGIDQKYALCPLTCSITEPNTGG